MSVKCFFPPPCTSSSAFNKTNNDIRPIRKERTDHSLASSPFQETSKGYQHFFLNQSASRLRSDTKETVFADCSPPPHVSFSIDMFRKLQVMKWVIRLRVEDRLSRLSVLRQRQPSEGVTVLIRFSTRRKYWGMGYRIKTVIGKQIFSQMELLRATRRNTSEGGMRMHFIARSSSPTAAL